MQWLSEVQNSGLLCIHLYKHGRQVLIFNSECLSQGAASAVGFPARSFDLAAGAPWCSAATDILTAC